MRYPEDWNSRDILWSQDRFECIQCDNLHHFGERCEDINGDGICNDCLTGLENEL